ncbi:universal stress protein [Caldimonas tepidiphila]|uniref:universal stress protein n=1 Tax=Caldimonas tepidiphila TaxID=2315841 RepID=UPI000E5BC72A|nr:universal stress protein [Caldimonas tepidiphila]
MPYRSILVALDAGARCAPRIALAAQLAAEHDAHLVGLAPTGTVFMPPDPSGGGLGANYLQLSIDFLRQEAGKQAERFRAQVAPLGLRSFEALVDAEDPAPSVIAHARLADLVVVGQHEPGSASSMPPDLPQQVLMDSGRPVLIVPYAAEAAAPGRTVLVAWDRSREAARAVSDALPLLGRAAAVHVVMFLPAGDTDLPGTPPGADLAQWLARHGVRADVARVPTPIDTGNALLSHAADLGADLIVMGGYGHSRLRETVLGGVTRTVLRHMTVPVLMSH